MNKLLQKVDDNKKVLMISVPSAILITSAAVLYSIVLTKESDTRLYTCKNCNKLYQLGILDTLKIHCRANKVVSKCPYCGEKNLNEFIRLSKDLIKEFQEENVE